MFSLPGLAYAELANSYTEFAGTLGPTSSIREFLVLVAVGVKSAMG